MIKRGKKRNGKRNSDMPPNEGNSVPQTEAEQTSQLPFEVCRQISGGPMVDLTFFRTSGQLYGELHHRLSRVSREAYTEESVLQTGMQILQALDALAEAVDPRSESRSSCPFVMLLSMLLPTLRKYLTWTKSTRSLWGSNFVSLRHQSTTSDGAIYRGEADTVLWAMLAQHDVLTRVSLQTAHILRLIESSEGADHDGAHSNRTTRQSKAPKPPSQASSGSSTCSSVASTPRDPTGTGIARTPRLTRDKPCPVPQIWHISMELANVAAEYKVHLADLAEILVEVVEMIAKHLCTPTASKDAGRARISAREFIERLVQHLLEPLGQRMLAEPSASYIDLFPRLLEQCITVSIDNFARSNGNQNELQAAPFEAGVMHLRTWTFKLEIEYNTLLRSMSNNSNNTDLSTDTDTSDNAALNATYDTNNRMGLMTLGGFKRLETTLSSWLNAAASSTSGGPDLGSGTSARSWGVSSLAGGIRSTLVRTFSGRATFGGPA
ncbi:hypothetical protein PHYPSEUDO_006298 [Phytophthora pseudosyringae]|uniref:Uncharacterized protein n=1 Tax=Phytophthora pseudosyringae TaxID=221518 RepID=A0A8T1VJ33_9STRA|nr:hypothetical protein PHYPSEUDO_006298 [Phytophthora pseudosyringae]